MSTPNDNKRQQLISKLKELFQLDQPDLDFGLSRTMHAKSAEITQFLEKDLLPQVQAAFALYKTADKAEIEKELAKVIADIEAAGMDPNQSPKVKELRAKLQSEAVDVGGLEGEVYDHLLSFFRRYYSEGDFLSRHVYKAGVYAIPYEGEEVKLHWANADQYYIKTSEFLRDYTFRLRPGSQTQPLRVHFRLVDAAEDRQGNAKVDAAGHPERRQGREAMMAAVHELAPALGTAAACAAVGLWRGAPGRQRAQARRAAFVGPRRPHTPRPRPPLALDAAEHQLVLDNLNSERFADTAQAAVHATVVLPGSRIDLPQCHAQPPGPRTLERRTLQPVHRIGLRCAPAAGVLAHAPQQIAPCLGVWPSSAAATSSGSVRNSSRRTSSIAWMAIAMTWKRS